MTEEENEGKNLVLIKNVQEPESLASQTLKITKAFAAIQEQETRAALIKIAEQLASRR